MSDPSPAAAYQAEARPPRAYLGWSLVATIAFFLPLGLVAIYYGLRTRRAVSEERLEDASHASHLARGWLVAAVVMGVLVWAFIGVVLVLLGAWSS
jgi:TRAP-type mannitol/chloroaromatic compound transport system permease small subunit